MTPAMTFAPFDNMAVTHSTLASFVLTMIAIIVILQEHVPLAAIPLILECSMPQPIAATSSLATTMMAPATLRPSLAIATARLAKHQLLTAPPVQMALISIPHKNAILACKTALFVQATPHAQLVPNITTSAWQAQAVRILLTAQPLSIAPFAISPADVRSV